MNSQTTVIGRWAEMLENLEAARKRVSASLPLGAKAELGQFLTPNDVARFMAGMFRQEQDELQILDPGAGIGSLTAALVAAVAGRSRPVKSIRATLYEVDLQLADELRLTMEACKDLCGESRIHFQYDICAEDFIDAIASALVSPMTQPLAGKYDCVILNPPYRKLSSDTPTRRILREAGIEVNNLYSAFLSLAARLLKNDGELVAITPRSFCNGPYFKAFRYEFFSRIVGTGAGITWILRGLLRCGGCGRLMSTHTVRSGPVIHGYYRCRSTAGGREACKGVTISAYEIETAVLSEIGAGTKRTSKEQQAAVRAAVHAAVYDVPSGNVKIKRIGPRGGMIASSEIK